VAGTAEQRPTSVPVQSTFGGGDSERASAAVDPLRYVKTDTSPLAEDARQTMDQLQRQRPHARDWDAGPDDDSSWQAVYTTSSTTYTDWVQGKA